MLSNCWNGENSYNPYGNGNSGAKDRNQGNLMARAGSQIINNK